MTAPRFGALLGVFFAALWAVAGFWWVLLAAVLGVIGWTVGLIAEGRLDVTKYLGQDNRDTTATSTRRTPS